ncbi:MAG: hypothetical protein JO026_03900 [Patescibacteria group bacterium]|nr:hypothetical protein [Patescibacteria group bacterium]
MKRGTLIVIIIVLLAIGFFSYSHFFGGSSEPLLATESGNGNPAVDQDLINLLLTLKNIRLDNSLFADPAYQSLQDFGKDLVPEPVGRPNPFAPLGNISAASQAGAASSAGAPSIGTKK